MQIMPLRVGIVNYLNTKPLLYGLQQLHEQNVIELILDYPANVATALQNNTIDIGLVPIAILPKLPTAQIIGNHCISSNKQVASVCLFSKVPISEIETVLLDYQSRTSVQLVQILFKKYWKRKVLFKSATTNYISEINGTTAAVIIGDRAFEQLQNYPYVYDLAEAWNTFTSLPFVFAAWVSNVKLSAEFLAAFEKANALGLDHLVSIAEKQNYEPYDLQKYYTENISYVLDTEKRKAIELFLQYIQDL
jgi:chorismate dehydratase